MDSAWFISAVDFMVAGVVIGGAIGSLVALTFLGLGLGRSASLGDDVIEAYVDEELRRYDRTWDVENQSWVYSRRAS